MAAREVSTASRKSRGLRRRAWRNSFEGGRGVAVAEVEKAGGGVGEVVERCPQLGEIDHLDGAAELAAAFEDVRHSEGVGGLEVAAFELAIEVVGAVVVPQP